MRYFEDALKAMREQGVKVKRAKWGRNPQCIMLVDPSIYPTVEGDTEEYSVFIRSVAGNPESVPVCIKRECQTKKEAEAFVADQLPQVEKLEERFKKYQELLKLRAAGPLDYAVLPQYSSAQLKDAWVVKTAKPGSRRLGKPYLAALVSDNYLEVYTITMDDLAADDWRIA